MEERTLTEQFESHESGTVLGLCPGCQNWQLDWTLELALAPVAVHGNEVEAVLLDHARECPGLTRIAMEKAIPIYPRTF